MMRAGSGIGRLSGYFDIVFLLLGLAGTYGAITCKYYLLFFQFLTVIGITVVFMLTIIVSEFFGTTNSGLDFYVLILFVTLILDWISAFYNYRFFMQLYQLRKASGNTGALGHSILVGIPGTNAPEAARTFE
jgi:hypothetical protein